MAATSPKSALARTTILLSSLARRLRIRPKKLYPKPDKRARRGLTCGDKIDVTPLIAARSARVFEKIQGYWNLADQGARILVVAYNTDRRNSHLRMRYCAQACATGTEAFVMTSDIGIRPGNLSYHDFHHAQNGNSDNLPFTRDGIARGALKNVTMTIMANVSVGTVLWPRAHVVVRRTARPSGPMAVADYRWF